MAERPALTLEEAQVPLRLEAVPVETDLSRAQRTLAGLGSDCPATKTLVDDGYLPPEALVAGSVHLLSSHYEIAGGIYAREQLTLLRPVRLDEQLVVSGSLASRFVKRKRLYRQVLSTTRDRDGHTVASSRTTSLGRFRPQGRRGAMNLDRGSAEPPPISPRPENHDHLPTLGSLSEGRSMTASPRLYTLSMMQAETGPDDRNPIHTDPAVARAAGLAKPIAGGPHVLSSLLELLHLELGGHALSHGAHLDVRWISPVEDGDAVTARVVVTGRSVTTLSLEGSASVGERLAMLARIEIPLHDPRSRQRAEISREVDA
ncbi:MAG: MaoC family dehydratase [Acidobacteriota bacterium]